MKKKTFTILFFARKSRVARNGEVPVMLRVTIDGQRAEASVNLKTDLKSWSDVAGRSLGDKEKDLEVNQRLDTIRMRIMQIYREMEFDKKDITAKKIVDKYAGKDEVEVIMLLDVFREHNERCEKLIGHGMAPATVVRYRTSLRHTADFIKFQFKKDDIPIQEVNHKFITDYEFYLKTGVAARSQIHRCIYTLTQTLVLHECREE